MRHLHVFVLSLCLSPLLLNHSTLLSSSHLTCGCYTLYCCVWCGGPRRGEQVTARGALPRWGEEARHASAKMCGVVASRVQGGGVANQFSARQHAGNGETTAGQHTRFGAPALHAHSEAGSKGVFA